MFWRKKKTEVFERKKLKKSIEKAKEVRALYDDSATDKCNAEHIKKEYEEMSEMLTMAIEAMKIVLYDL